MIKLTKSTQIVVFALGLMAVAAPLCAEAPKATLQVSLIDENGPLKEVAHIYIFSLDKKKFFGTRQAKGHLSFELPSGEYLVYAGFTSKSHGIFDHFASPEANVHVTSSEPTSVMLNLTRAEEPEMVLSDNARKKLGIDEELAKHLN